MWSCLVIAYAVALLGLWSCLVIAYAVALLGLWSCLVIAYAVALLGLVVLLGDRPLGCSLTCFLFYLFTFLLLYPFTFKKCATY